MFDLKERASIRVLLISACFTKQKKSVYVRQRVVVCRWTPKNINNNASILGSNEARAKNVTDRRNMCASMRATVAATRGGAWMV